MLQELKGKVLSVAQRKGEEKVEEIEKNPMSQRVKEYISFMPTGNIEGLVNALLEDIDKEKILEEVQTLQEKYPDLTPQELSMIEINSTAKAMSGVAIGSGLSWVIPGVALLTGPLATAGEIIGLFVFQSRLVVKIAAFFGLDISSKERARDVVVCIACSSASIGGAKLAGKALEMAIQKYAKELVKIVTKKLAQTSLKSVPGIGSLAGVFGGAVGAVSNYYAVKGVGSYATKIYGDSSLIPYGMDDSFDKAILYVAILVAKADGVVTDEENKLIEGLVKDSPLMDKQKKEIMERIKGQLTISDIQGEFSEEDKKELITIAIKISMADQEIEKSELNIISDLAGVLSVDTSYVHETIKKYKKALEIDFTADKDAKKFLMQEEAQDNPFVIHT